MNPRSPVPAVAPFFIETAGPWLAAVPGATKWPAAGRFPAILGAPSWPDQGNRSPPRITLCHPGHNRSGTRGLTPFHALFIGPPACETAGGRTADNGQRLDPANAL